MKRLICAILSVCLIFGLFLPFATSASWDGDELPEFKDESDIDYIEDAEGEEELSEEEEESADENETEADIDSEHEEEDGEEVDIAEDDEKNETLLYFNIEIDEEHNVTIAASGEIDYEIMDEGGDGQIILLIRPEDFDIGFDISLPEGWTYEIHIDKDAAVITIIIDPFDIGDSIVEALEVYIELDEERNVSVVSSREVSYEVIDDGNEGDILVVFNFDGIEAEICEDNFSFNLPNGWIYEIEINADMDNVNITATLSNKGKITEKALEIRIEMDSGYERNVTVTAPDEINHKVIDESGEGDIIVILEFDDETEITEGNVEFDLPFGWAWIYDFEMHMPIYGLDTNHVVIVLYNEMTSLMRQAPFAPFFSQEEIDDPNMWYAEPDFEITLAATPTTNAYTRLRNAIQDAIPNAITHIIIPFHINTGGIPTNGSTVRVPNGATVVLIGAHPTAPNGQIVISDTHDNSNVSRIFRVRGNNTERCALVLRNVALQNASPSASQAAPANPPTPLGLSQQTGNIRGGGVAIESTDGGGGHLILCNGSEIRNNTTDNNGSIDVQNNGTLTMMPGSLIHNNAAGNSGGGVNVNGSGARFFMYGGEIRGNIARGENTGSAQMRAVGGGVLVQNGATFNMYDGVISGNRARLDEVVPNNLISISATNALVTSSGGGIFATGAGSTFNMYGGTISANLAERTRSSAPGTATNRELFRSGNGGGVYLTLGATFNMEGGSIIGNTATASGTVSGNNAPNVSNGGGVYLTGASTTFNMIDGLIENNEAVRTLNSITTTAATAMSIIVGNGGGVHVFDGAVFTMDGGKVESNTARATGTNPDHNVNGIVTLSNGGGVFVSSGASFIMNDGEIENNNATGTVAASSSISGNGGGVYVNSALASNSAFVMNGGSISDNTAKVANSAYQRGGGGVYLGGVASFVMNGGKILRNTASSLAGALWQGGGGVNVSGSSRFEMRDGEVSYNTSTLEGGGINIGPTASMVMYGGSIEYNMSHSSARGGGGIWVMGGSFATANATDQTTTKTISNNSTWGHGGGIGVQGQEAGQFTGNSGSVTIVSGTVISGNRAGVEQGQAVGGGLGGGILAHDNASLNIQGGEISDNYAFRSGGGIALWHSSTLTMTDGVIKDNKTVGNGGGLIMGGTASIINMQGGKVLNNIADDGGGMFIPHTDLNNVTISSDVDFFENVARNGVRIDDSLATAHHPRINPGMVSLAWIRETPVDSNNFSEADPHAFTNYDINSNGPRFWRVTYGVDEGAGDVEAKVGDNEFPVANGHFVPHGTTVTFTAELAHMFKHWGIGTRALEVDGDGNEIEFDFYINEENPPLLYDIVLNTHVLGNFSEGFKITYHPNGGMGETHIKLVPAGVHQITHRVEHEDTSIRFIGWNTEADGSGDFYAVGDHIVVAADVVLYAQFDSAATTLTISKTITGPFADMNAEFEFTIIFQDSSGNPLAEDSKFGYIGDIIAGLSATAPADGVLILDEDGSATFTLGHGQAIIISGVPLDIYIQIIETSDKNYDPSFIDSENAGISVDGNDTTLVAMTENRTFSFNNNRVDVPITGLNLSNSGTTILMPILLSLSGATIFTIGTVFRKRKGTLQE